MTDNPTQAQVPATRTSVLVECLTDESGSEWFVSFYVDRAKYNSNSVRSEAQAEAMAAKLHATLAAHPQAEALAVPTFDDWWHKEGKHGAKAFDVRSAFEAGVRAALATRSQATQQAVSKS